MGFGRVYSGVLRRGDTIYAVVNAYDPMRQRGACQEIVVEDLFLMMGQGMFKVDQVPAGNILAIGGLDKYVLKERDAVQHENLRAFGNMMFQVAPIVKVAVEPENVANMAALAEELQIVESPASGRVDGGGVMETGEHVHRLCRG